MSKRLKQIIDRYLLLNGKGAREALCAKVGISYSTLAHALGPKGRHYPLKPQTIVQLALACGLTDKEALTLAGDGASKGKRSA